MSSVSVQIDHESDIPIRAQIVEAYSEAILNGKIKCGTRLPSIRALALRLRVSPATIVAAYHELTSRSLVQASPRSSFFVLGTNASQGSERKTIQMNRIEPDLRIHPVQEFLRILPTLTAEDLSIGGYEDYRGFLGLREAIAEWDRHLGVVSDPEREILITSGAQQAITLTARLFGPGTRVAIEDPCHPGARKAFQAVGAEIIPIKMTRDGPDPVSLARISAPGEVSVFYCCPTYGNPSGNSWGEEARLRVLEASRKGNFLILEDDYLSDLDYLDERLPRLAALASRVSGSSVARIRTFSKTLLPALRLASVTGDSAFISRLLAQKVSDDIGSSAITQRGLAHFMKEGLYGAHLSRVRPRYLQTREALRASLARFSDGIEFDDPPAGLCMLGRLTGELEISRFVSECAREGVLVSPGGDYWHNPQDGLREFRLGFGALSPDEAEFASRAFATALARSREYSVDYSLI
jgi:DNA-binding transcriptional MocR family regulator